MESDGRSSWALGLSLIEVMLLLVFGVMLVYTTGAVEGRGQEPHQNDAQLQAKFNAAMETNDEFAKRLKDMTLFVDELRLMVGAKGSTKEGFQEAVDTLKQGYALCQKNGNTLIEANVQNGAEAIQVIGEIPSDLRVSLAKGDQTSDLEEIVTFLQDVYEYEKDQGCRFNYRLKYVTDNDYRKAREGFVKYFYPEKMIRIG